jgi:hypothetical protein
VTTTLPGTGRPGPSPRPSRSWPLPLSLVLLSLVPVVAGTLRLVQLLGGPAIIHADHRFDSSPAPVVVHVIGALVFALVGILQLVPRFRRRHLVWHRRAGRVLAVAGLLVAGSALWMTLFFQQKAGTTDLLYVLRLVFATGMAACLVLGVTSVRRRDLAAHRAWMIRGYAIAVAAGTQAFTVGLGGALIGTAGIRYDVLMGAAWFLNLGVAEWAIRRPARRARRARAAVLTEALA